MLQKNVGKLVLPHDSEVQYQPKPRQSSHINLKVKVSPVSTIRKDNALGIMHVMLDNGCAFKS